MAGLILPFCCGTPKPVKEARIAQLKDLYDQLVTVRAACKAMQDVETVDNLFLRDNIPKLKKRIAHGGSDLQQDSHQRS